MSSESNAPASKHDTPDTFTKEQVERIVEDRLRRERSKYADYDDLKAKAAKFDELEGSTRSDVERLTKRVEEAEARASKAELDYLRLEVAVEKGLTPAQAKRLVGTTKDELEADADDLLAAFGGKSSSSDDDESKSDEPGGDGSKAGTGSGTTPPPGKPRENLKGGTDPTVEVAETDPAKLAALVPRGGI